MLRQSPKVIGLVSLELELEIDLNSESLVSIIMLFLIIWAFP